MSTYKIALLPGDGIGPEISSEAVKMLKAVEEVFGTPRFEFETMTASAALFLDTGITMPDSEYETCTKADAMLMGAIGLPHARRADGTEVAGDAIFRLRFGMDLYAGVRPVRLLPNVRSPLHDTSRGIDYVVVRENVEGLYASRDGGSVLRNEVATDTIVITREGTSKVVDYAFRLAQKRKGRPLDGKSVVTCVDKSNVLTSYAFFRSVFNDVAREYPDIEADYAYVDAMTVYQVQSPQDYDVLVAENMFGDIISDLSSATVGGLGLAPSADVGEKHGLFQPAHGSAPTIAGKGIANPVAMILSAAMMLDWLADQRGDDDARRAAAAVTEAVEQALSQGKELTPDLGGKGTTRGFGNAAVAALRALG